MYKWSIAEYFGSVRLMVREKISSQADGRKDEHSEYISVFFPMKKAIKMRLHNGNDSVSAHILPGSVGSEHIFHRTYDC